MMEDIFNFFYIMGWIMFTLLSLCLVSTFFINKIVPNPIQDINTLRMILGIAILSSSLSIVVCRPK